MERSGDLGPIVDGLAVSGEERHHVFGSEASIASLADAEEGQIATVAKSLDGVDMQVQEVRDLTGGQHGSEFVNCHRSHGGGVPRGAVCLGRLLGWVSVRSGWGTNRVVGLTDGCTVALRVSPDQAVLASFGGRTEGVACGPHSVDSLVVTARTKRPELATRSARATDAEAIARIYNEGIEDRTSTFETAPRDASVILGWLGARYPIVVAELSGSTASGDPVVVGWASAPPYRPSRAAYRGVADFSVQSRRRWWGDFDSRWVDSGGRDSS